MNTKERLKMDILIRDAKLGDETILVHLIQQLAVYERKSSDEIGISKEKIIKHCFSDKPYFHAKIVEYNQIPVGYAIYYFTYAAALGQPRLYLEDLFIHNDYRNKGLGKSLIKNLSQLAIANDCCCLEWHVFQWNNNAIAFYDSVGITKKNDSLLVRLEGESLQALSKS